MLNRDLKNKALERLKEAQKTYKELGDEANELALHLHELRKSAVLAIDRIEKYINSLANSPKEFEKNIAEVQLSIKDFREAVRIEKESAADNLKGAGIAAGGVVFAGLMAKHGPVMAVKIAKQVGTASTGAKIKNLKGVAADNAAKAFLGGGSRATGGRGIDGGNELLRKSVPLAIVAGALLLLGGGVYASHKNKKTAQKAETKTREVCDHIYGMRPKVMELRRLCNQTRDLKSALNIAKFSLFPSDYSEFNDEQKMLLVALLNNTRTMGELINKRIDL